MLDRTIWERLRLIPAKQRTKLRRGIAKRLHIGEHSVLKHLQGHGWSNIKESYKGAIVSATGINENDWKNAAMYIKYNEANDSFFTESAESLVLSILSDVEGGAEL